MHPEGTSQWALHLGIPSDERLAIVVTIDSENSAPEWTYSALLFGRKKEHLIWMAPSKLYCSTVHETLCNSGGVSTPICSCFGQSLVVQNQLRNLTMAMSCTARADTFTQNLWTHSTRNKIALPFPSVESSFEQLKPTDSLDTADTMFEKVCGDAEVPSLYMRVRQPVEKERLRKCVYRQICRTHRSAGNIKYLCAPTGNWAAGVGAIHLLRLKENSVNVVGKELQCWKCLEAEIGKCRVWAKAKPSRYKSFLIPKIGHDPARNRSRAIVWTRQWSIYWWFTRVRDTSWTLARTVENFW